MAASEGLAQYHNALIMLQQVTAAASLPKMAEHFQSSPNSGIDSPVSVYKPLIVNVFTTRGAYLTHPGEFPRVRFQLVVAGLLLAVLLDQAH